MLQTLNTLCFSVYLSTFDKQKELLEEHAGSEAPSFLSLHIKEEIDDTYCQKIEDICHWLSVKQYRIIADISPVTLAIFKIQSIKALADKLHLWAVRLDYGFTNEQIIDIGQTMPIVLNASTLSAEMGHTIITSCPHVMAMHNFYPRPETGLDSDYLYTSTKKLQEMGVKVLAFIPGNLLLRGPIYEHLPTLECHRNVLPSVAYVDLAVTYKINGIFLGDGSVSKAEYTIINQFCRHGILLIPCILSPQYHSLYQQTFTCRIDSPKRLVRFAESREYSCFAPIVEPEHCIERTRGSITIDNKNYNRYSGEIQLIRSSLSADARVNVIGTVETNHINLIDYIQNGSQFMLIPADDLK